MSGKSIINQMLLGQQYLKVSALLFTDQFFRMSYFALSSFCKGALTIIKADALYVKKKITIIKS